MRPLCLCLPAYRLVVLLTCACVRGSDDPLPRRKAGRAIWVGGFTRLLQHSSLGG